MVILRKKFFYSDTNIDRNDPIQLNLLYVQSRDGIISGKHPCTPDEASQFAALQCQVTNGNFDESKHKPGFLNLKEFLPEEYRKNKEVEKKIFVEYRKLQGMSEINAKYRYVQLCRSLKTYGVTFFLVKEKETKKNKMIPRLLGITKSSIMRFDADTKEILKTWPITTLRRWAASPNSFTLDFGDYQDAYYTIQTTEGEAMSQLIAGYIDIILKKKKEAERGVAEGTEEVAVSEEVLKPAKAQAINISHGKMNQAQELKLAQNAMVAEGGQSSQKTVPTITRVMQKANVSDMNSARVQPVITIDTSAQGAVLKSLQSASATVNVACADMGMVSQLPALGNDAAALLWKQQTSDTNLQNLIGQIASHLASLASAMNQTNLGPEKMDMNVLGGDIATIASNITGIAASTKLLAALAGSETEGDALLEAAKNVGLATSKFLNSIQPVVLGNGNKEELYTEAQKTAAACNLLLQKCRALEVDSNLQKKLLESAKAISSATQDLVNKAKLVAGAMTDKADQLKLIEAVKACASSASHLAVTTSVVAPSVIYPACFDQLTQSSQFMNSAVQSLVSAGESSVSGPTVDQLKEASKRVNAAIADLLAKAKSGPADAAIGNAEIEKFIDGILVSSAALLQGLNDPAVIVQCVKDLTVNSSSLANALKQRTSTMPDGPEKSRLHAALRGLADATSKMVGAAKDLAKSPNDATAQAKLRQVIEEMHSSIATVSGVDLREKAFAKLAQASKAMAVSSTVLVAAGTSAALSNQDQQSQGQVNKAIKKVVESNTALATANRLIKEKPTDVLAQMKLMSTAKNIIDPATSLITASKNASQHVEDPSVKVQLENATSKHDGDVKELTATLGLVNALSNGLELDSVLQSIAASRAEIAGALASPHQLTPETNQSLFSTQADFKNVCRKLGSSLTQLLTAATQNNEKQVATAARETAESLQALTSVSKGLAATCVEVTGPGNELEMQKLILNNAGDILEKSTLLMNVVKESINTPGAPATKARLTDSAKALNMAVTVMIDNLPSQKDLAKVATSLVEAVKNLGNASSAVNGLGGENAKDALFSASSLLAVACNNLITASSSGSPADIKKAALDLEAAFQKLVSAAKTLGDSGDAAAKVMILQELASKSAGLLSFAAAASTSSSVGSSRDQLLAAAQGVSASINKVLQVCASSVPGQVECATALQTLASCHSKLSSIAVPADTQETYFESLAKVVELSKSIANTMNSVSSTSRSGDIPKLLSSVQQLSNEISTITDATVRAAYLIGISDPESSPGVSAVISSSTISSALTELKDSFDKLSKASSQAEVLAAANIIGKHANTLCTVCKTAAGKPQSVITPTDKQQFISFAKTIAGSTQNLVASLKALAVNITPENRSKCLSNAAPVLQAIESLATFADSPQFHAALATFTPDAQAAQQPVIENTRKVIKTGENIINATKSVCQNPKDSALLQLLNQHIKSSGEALKLLAVTMKESAPGQKECLNAIEIIQGTVTELDAMILKAAIEGLPKFSMGMGMEGAAKEDEKAKLLGFIRVMGSKVDDLVRAAKKEPGDLGSAATDASNAFAPVSGSAIKVATDESNPQVQQQILDCAKEIGENLASLLDACKTSGGNILAVELHETVDQQRNTIQSSFKKLSSLLEDNSDTDGTFAQATDVVQSTIQSLDTVSSSALSHSMNGTTKMTSSKAIDAVNKAGKELVETVGEVMVKAKTSEQYKLYATKAGSAYAELAHYTQVSMASTKDESMKKKLDLAIRGLGKSVIKMTESMKFASVKPNDPSSRQKVSASCREVSSNVLQVMNAVKESAKAFTQCEEALSAIRDGVLSDLEAAIVFAESGSLDPMTPDNIRNHSRVLQESAKNLILNVNGVISGVQAGQDEWAAAVTASSSAMVLFKDQVKAAATSITSVDKHMQIRLLEVAKKMAESLQKLVTTSITALDAPANGNEMQALTNLGKQVAMEANELFKVVETVSDESTKAIRSLDGAINDLESLISQIKSNTFSAEGTATPEEVTTLSKHLATLSASLVSTSSSGKQDEIISALSSTRKVSDDLMRACLASIENAPADQKSQMKGYVTKLATSLQHLYKSIQSAQQGTRGKPVTGPAAAQVQAAAKEVAVAVNGMVSFAASLVPGGYVDPNDPNVIAERELLAAAAAIDAAAQKLLTLQPPPKPSDQAANQNLNFEEQIFEAAKAIAAATSALVRSATSCQREIISKGSRSQGQDKMYFSDGTWSDGLVSAAKAVAEATQDLCSAANDAIKGEVSSERVIAAARAVSASTTQVLTAASVRADPHSQSQIRLRAAGKSVTVATDNLVKAAETTAMFEDQNTNVFGANKVAGASTNKRLQEIEAHTDVLKMEKELEKARAKLAGIRKAKYENK
ncbi:hypothetical protein BKA69DRAFT_292544 [Paraphysoderma sedebokerense]|nr:hypothetical protein BKA69DRAFT_292544 [Paraphysoderma sedebokerense]